MISSWIICVGPKSNDKRPYKRYTGRRGEGPVKTGRDQHYVATKQAMLAVTRRWKRKAEFSPRGFGDSKALEIARPCQYLDFGLLAFRTVREHISVILSSPVCGNLLQQLQRTNTPPVSSLSRAYILNSFLTAPHQSSTLQVIFLMDPHG